jgi:hypothetical protein
VVDDLDDSGELAGVGVVAIDDNDTANLNEAPGGTLDQCFTHCAVVCKRNMSWSVEAFLILRAESLAGGRKGSSREEWEFVPSVECAYR